MIHYLLEKRITVCLVLTTFSLFCGKQFATLPGTSSPLGLISVSKGTLQFTDCECPLAKRALTCNLDAGVYEFVSNVPLPL